MASGDDRRALLACRVGGRSCALPLDCVLEVMRPLPIAPIAGAPPCVRGLAVIRGAEVPVVDASVLVTGVPGTPQRFVVVRVGERRVALAVDGVPGVVSLARAELRTLPPLLRDADADAIAAVGVRDRELLLVLDGARLLPERAPA